MKRYSKAIGAAVGLPIGAAIATLLVYALESAGVEVPENVKQAVEVIVTALITILTVYLAPANTPPKAMGRRSFLPMVLVPLFLLVPLAIPEQAQAQTFVVRAPVVRQFRPFRNLFSRIRSRVQARREARWNSGRAILVAPRAARMPLMVRSACEDCGQANWLGVPQQAFAEPVEDVQPVRQSAPPVWYFQSCPDGNCLTSLEFERRASGWL